MADKTRFTRMPGGTNVDEEMAAELFGSVSVTWSDKLTGDHVKWNASDLNPVHFGKVFAYGLAKLAEDRTSAASEGEKLAARREIIEFFKGTEWKKPRAAGGPTVSAEIEALAQLKGASVAAIQTALRKKYTKEQREEILASDEVQEKAAEIRKARENEVDLDDLL